jgi:hypothetical protein
VIGGTSLAALSAAVKLIVVGCGVPGAGVVGPPPQDTARNNALTAMTDRFIVISP